METTAGTKGRKAGGLSFAFAFYGAEFDRYTGVFDSKSEAIDELRARAWLGLDRLSMAVPFSGTAADVATVVDIREASR
jgi:hypothetical protein